MLNSLLLLPVLECPSHEPPKDPPQPATQSKLILVNPNGSVDDKISQNCICLEVYGDFDPQRFLLYFLKSAF